MASLEFVRKCLIGLLSLAWVGGCKGDVTALTAEVPVRNIAVGDLPVPGTIEKSAHLSPSRESDIDNSTPGQFSLTVSQDKPSDATLEVHWGPSRGATHVRITLAAGESCRGAPESPPDSYDLRTHSVELPALSAGEYSICATAFDAADNSIEAENSGLSVFIEDP